MKRLLFLTGILFLVGCSVKTTPVYVTFKSPKLKISDQGFLKEGNGYKSFELYKAGASYKITLKNSVVCLNDKCMDKEKFIKEYFGVNYPSDFLDKVVEGKPVEEFGKVVKTKEGFIQKSAGIYYKATKYNILFKDKEKNVIVLIKKLRGDG